MAAFDDFYQWFQKYGLEYFNRYYGIYEGYVADNVDPEKRGRIRVRVPALDTNNIAPTWFYPAFMQTGDDADVTGAPYGWFWPPEIKDRVLVTFKHGDPSRPGYYFGAWYADGKVPALLGYPSEDKKPPTRRGFTLRTGHAFVFNEEADKEEIDLIWKKGDTTSTIKLLPNGSIEIKNKQESQVLIDAENKKVVIEDKDNSNVITLDSNGVKIETKAKVVVSGATEFSVDATSIKLGGSGASKSAVLGENLLQWLNSHTHPTGVGPSGPPAAPASASLLSKTVKVK